MAISIFLLVLFAVCVAFIYNEGLWSAAILWVNVLQAAIVATILWEPVANIVEGMSPSLTYLLDFIVIWLLFCLSLVVFRLTTDMLLSRHRVKFKKPLELGGGLFFAAWIGWIMLQFTAFTFHLAPLSRNFLGFEEKPDSKVLFGMLDPDRSWLGFIHHQSQEGPLARSAPASDPNAHVFDPQGDFIMKYGQRRMNYSKEPDMTAR